MLSMFDPVKLSLEENQFVLDHIGEPPVVAFRAPRDVQVTLAAVKPIIQGVYELMEVEKQDKSFEWVGVEAVKAAIKTYLTQAAKWEKNKGRPGAPRFPSMYSYDARGRAHWRGIGSDSDQVRTYFDDQGNRVPFAINLTPTGEETWRPDWLAKTPAITPRQLKDDPDLHRIECFCGHTEQYKEGSRSSFNAARARMSKHLRKATDQVDDHRDLHTNEFGG